MRQITTVVVRVVVRAVMQRLVVKDGIDARLLEALYQLRALRQASTDEIEHVPIVGRPVGDGRQCDAPARQMGGEIVPISLP